jgi:ribosomal protein L15E
MACSEIKNTDLLEHRGGASCRTVRQICLYTVGREMKNLLSLNLSETHTDKLSRDFSLNLCLVVARSHELYKSR